jgi:biopolymer transport protein ExbD
MSMAIRLGTDDDDNALVAAINTTPLVDIMLVLLIIFLITIPVVTHTVPVALPHERDQPTQTQPQDITIAIDKDGSVFWNETRVADNAALLARLEARAGAAPQPVIHIRADRAVRYEAVGRVVADCQRAGIAKLAFIVEPAPGAAGGR